MKKDNVPDLTAVDAGKMAKELEKSMAHIIVEIIEYVPNSVVTKTILKKSTGNISVMSFDTGEGLTEKTSPFDTFAQIIEGKAETGDRAGDHHSRSYLKFNKTQWSF